MATTQRNTTIELEAVSCPLCGGQQWRRHLQAPDYRYGVPGHFQLVRCDCCRHLYLNPRPVAAALADCYPSSYVPHQAAAARQDAARAQEMRPWYASGPMKALPGLRRLYYWLIDTRAEIIPPVAACPKRALEIGCASGRFLKQLERAGWSVQGVEMSEAAAERARAQGLPVHTGSLESAHLADEEFDAAFAWMVLEHLPDPRATLQELQRVLKPGGWLAISVPNVGCWEPLIFGRYWDAYDLPRHLQHFTPFTLQSLLRQTGFAQPEVWHQTNLLNVAGSLGICWRERLPGKKYAQRLIDYPHAPGMWSQLLLGPLARLLAALRQSGRITVLARRS